MIGNPNLNHEEVKQLYQYDHDIPKSIVEKILNLPRTTVIQDLEEILNEAVQNFEKYKKNAALFDGSKPHRFYAPLHAFLMLGALKSETSLPVFEEFLRQDGDVINFWLGDALIELLWQSIYNVSEREILQLIPFIKEPINDVFAKSAHQESLINYLFLQRASPQRKQVIEQIKALIHDLLAQARKSEESEEWDDEKDNLSLFIMDLILNGIVELSAEIKMVVNADFLEEYGAESWPEVQSMLHETPEMPIINTIYQQYEELKEWGEPIGIIGDSFDFDSYIGEDQEIYEALFDIMGRAEKSDRKIIHSSTIPFKHETPKVGRNEPCPCGSGKKYKKCCLKK